MSVGSSRAINNSASTTTKYNVETIDDLVHLTVSEVPLAHDHPDSEDGDGIYVVRGMTGATPVLLVAHGVRERKSWLQDLYSCIDDTVSKHYLRIGKPKKNSSTPPVEERKQVVHRELLGIMQLRKDEYFQYLRHSRASAVPSHLNKKAKEKKKKAPGGKRAALGRILPMGRRPSDAAEPTPTRTTQNPLAQVPLRQTMAGAGGAGGPPNALEMSMPAAAASGPGGVVGVVGGVVGVVDSAGLHHASKLHKSASVTQLDLLMAEMKNDPRAMIHLAPRLEHTMQRLNLHDSWDDERLRWKKEKERDREHHRSERHNSHGGGGGSGSGSHGGSGGGAGAGGRESDDEGSGSGSKSSFKRSLSLKMRGEKKYEKDRITTAAAAAAAAGEKERNSNNSGSSSKGGSRTGIKGSKDKDKDKEKEKEDKWRGGRTTTTTALASDTNNNNEEAEAEDSEEDAGNVEWDLSSSRIKRSATGSSSSSSSSLGKARSGTGNAPASSKTAQPSTRKPLVRDKRGFSEGRSQAD